jgi:hypothetical protein
MPCRILAHNLGVTALLATLWSVAALSGGIDGAAARALDPAVDGSLADAWALLQLAILMLVALSVAAPWPLVTAPALLLLGEAGELHIHAAALLASDHWITDSVAKAVALGALVLAAVGPLVGLRRSLVDSGAILAFCVLGMGGLILDATHGTQTSSPGMAWTTLEEWSELAAQTKLTSACLKSVCDRLYSGRSIAVSLRQVDENRRAAGWGALKAQLSLEQRP